MANINTLTVDELENRFKTSGGNDDADSEDLEDVVELNSNPKSTLKQTALTCFNCAKESDSSQINCFVSLSLCSLCNVSQKARFPKF